MLCDVCNGYLYDVLLCNVLFCRTVIAPPTPRSLRLSSLEALLEDAWAKLKALAQQQEVARLASAQSTAQTTLLRDQLLRASEQRRAAEGQAAASESRAEELGRALAREREAGAVSEEALRDSEAALAASGGRERVAQAQVQAVLLRLEEARQQGRQAAEVSEQLQGSVQALRAECRGLEGRCEAEEAVARQLQAESRELQAEKARMQEAQRQQVGALETQLQEQRQSQQGERRRAQEAAALLEEENGALLACMHALADDRVYLHPSLPLSL